MSAHEQTAGEMIAALYGKIALGSQKISHS